MRLADGHKPTTRIMFTIADHTVTAKINDILGFGVAVSGAAKK
jgi:hypothetical protein